MNWDGDESAMSIWESLRSLPLFDDLYLHMQAMNIDLIDKFLEDQEAELLAEYIRRERTPSMEAMFVSALSQLWVFGIYELLRTWRQRVAEVLRWCAELDGTPANDRSAAVERKKVEVEGRIADPYGRREDHWTAYERVEAQPEFGEELQEAFDRSERIFRRIEAFRVTLAKHEVPKSKGTRGIAPGYGRIHGGTGSIYWQVILRGKEVDLLSRREIADEVRDLSSREPLAILPRSVQDQMKTLPYYSYGVKKVIAVTAGGEEYSGILVAWNKEVLNPGKLKLDEVVAVRSESGTLDEETNDD